MATIFEPRTYRDFGDSDRFVAFRVLVEQSDLFIRAHHSLEMEAERLLRIARAQITAAIDRRDEFLTSLEPIDEDTIDAPIVCHMVRAGRKAGIGPMAAVAGAVADYVGRELLEHSPELIIENGGDIFIKVDHPIIVGLFAGQSPFSNRIGLRVEPTILPLGICTSSASVGHSTSLGNADAATIISKDLPLADGVATALGNRIKESNDLKKGVEWAMNVPGVDGALAILGDQIAATGEIELVSL
jgi:ApbE superfamily uncharacterized protein (UPF0280 family)